jgi:formylglycine-generating enzyme required for sulfatase activity
LQNFQAVCLAIEYAHSKGVLHCDIKPDNIMIGDYGEVFVVDWGLVVVCGNVKGSSEMHELETLNLGIVPKYKPSELASSGLHKQQGGSRRGVGGTPAYMAPEQFTATMSEEISLVTPKVDIYALGSTLYHILTGKAPHLPKEGVKESPDAFYFRITTGMIPTPREKDASIPKLLEQIVLKAMQVKPVDRYASARELAEDIKRYVSDEPVHAYQESGLEKSRRWIRKNKNLVGAAMLMLLLVAMVAIGFVFVLEGQNQKLMASKKEIEKERDRANSKEQLASEKLKDLEDEAERRKKIAEFAKEKIDPDLVMIPAGSFQMGTPKTDINFKLNEMLHEVIISKPFKMGKFEVTKEQWNAVMNGGKLSLKEFNKMPISGIDWEDCQSFIEILNKSTKQHYRLPTEAEWEYACRAGTKTYYSFGDKIDGTKANYENSSRKIPNFVGTYKPNPWGLYDMHGNVWEWCEDWYNQEYSLGPITDPKGPSSGKAHVLRGGSFNDKENALRSAFRYMFQKPTLHNFGTTGFRLVKEISESKPTTR